RGRRQEITTLKINRRNRISRHELLEIDVTCLLGREPFQLLISHDHILLFVDFITAHNFVSIEILTSLLGVILTREWLPVWSKHAQRRTSRALRRKQTHRHTHESKRQRSRPKRSTAGILLFGFHCFARSSRQRVSPSSSTTQYSSRARCRAQLS